MAFAEAWIVLAFEVGGALVGTGPAALQAPDPRLSPGSPVRVCLAPGEHRDFRIAADPLVPRRVEVGQQGVPLVVALTAPDGGITRVADQEGRYTRESLVLEPRPAGDFQLDVRARQPMKVPACFSLQLETLAGTTPEERRRAEAEAATAEAQRLQSLDTPETRREALGRYREALSAWQALGDISATSAITETLFHLAVLDRLAGEYDRALAALPEILARMRRAGDLPGEATVLNEMGFDRATKGDVEPARELYRQALARWEAVPDALGRAIALNNLALSYHSQGDLRTARTHYEQALALLGEIGDLTTEAVVTNNLGGVFQVLGEPGEARVRYEQALGFERQLGDRHAEAQMLGNLGSIEHDTGHYQEALTDYSLALGLLRQEGDRTGEARILNSLGLVHRSTGELRQAREALEAALVLRREGKDRRGEAITLHNLAVTLRDAGDPAGAKALYEQALALQRTLGDRRAEAVTLTGLAALDLAAGRRDEAGRKIAASIEILRALGDRRQLCEALRQSGRIAAADAVEGLASERLGEALALCRATHDREGEARTLLSLAAVERGAGLYAPAEDHATAALDVLESLRAGVLSLDLRASFLARQEDAYAFTRDLLLEHHQKEPAAGYDRQAFAVAERGRARSLLELLAEAGSDPGTGIDPALRERRAALAQRLDAKAKRRMELADRPRAEAERGVIEQEIEAILGELGTVAGEIRARSPRYAALTRPQPLGAEAVRGLLDPDTLLLAYSLGEERSVLFALTASSFASFPLPPRREIEKAVRQVLDDWRVLDPAARREEARAAAALSDLLLGPVADRLPGRRLVVVADGALHFLPFAALPEPGTRERLLAGHEIVNLPSASVLAVQRERIAGRTPASGSVAILADPVFRRDDPRVRIARAAAPSSPLHAPGKEAERSGGIVDMGGMGRFDRLPWSRTEAEAIARAADPAQPPLLALDFNANLETVKDGRLRPYRFLHFATHGVLDGEHPALSGLVLSLVDEAGRERPGFLALHDVYDLDLNADLVVLSGCQTALGPEIRGEGLVGLVRGFFHAGAAAVVASLWRVEDRATSELMSRFYHALLVEGRRPPAALREAQRAMLKDPRFRDPFNWAGFALYGDWR